jgi:hypothetical protein
VETGSSLFWRALSDCLGAVPLPAHQSTTIQPGRLIHVVAVRDARLFTMWFTGRISQTDPTNNLRGLGGSRAVKSRLLSDGKDAPQCHSYIRGEKLTRAGLLPVRKLSAVSV